VESLPWCRALEQGFQRIHKIALLHQASLILSKFLWAVFVQYLCKLTPPLCLHIRASEEHSSGYGYELVTKEQW
jgi:hypothetical protein